MQWFCTPSTQASAEIGNIYESIADYVSETILDWKHLTDFGRCNTMYISDTQIFYTIHKLIQIRLRAKELREICACQAKHRISRKNMSINWVNKSHRAKSSLSIDIAFERITHKTNELKTYKYTHSHHLYNTRLERQLSTHTETDALQKLDII